MNKLNWPTAFVIAAIIFAGAFIYNTPTGAGLGSDGGMILKGHEGEVEDASRQVQEYIAFAASLDPKKYWDGVYNERWITNR